MGATYQTPHAATAIADIPRPDAASDSFPRLLEAAQAAGPLIREHGARGERERRVPKPSLDALTAAGLQRMLTPRSLGGFELDPVSCTRIIEEVATFDSAAAWSLQSANVNAWWAARLPEDGVTEIYGNAPNAMVAAAFHPPQQAVEVPGGFRVTGRAPFASTIHDCDWALFGAIIMDDGKPRMTEFGPAMIAVILRTSEVEILDTWHSLGMRGTDSNDVAFKDVFVPASRVFVLAPEFEPGRHFKGPLYRFPACGIIAIFSAGVVLASARNAITEFREIARKKTPFGSMKTLRERGSVQSALAEAEATLRSARAFLYEVLAETWARTVGGVPNTLEHRADLLVATITAAQSSARVTDIIQRLAGTTAIYERSPLDRYFRDTHTLRHHGFIAENKLEAAGQIYLGLEPDFPLITF